MLSPPLLRDGGAAITPGRVTLRGYRWNDGDRSRPLARRSHVCGRPTAFDAKAADVMYGTRQVSRSGRLTVSPPRHVERAGTVGHRHRLREKRAVRVAL